MTQKPLDLLPESVRLSCQAGLRTGRYLAAILAAIVVVVVATTHGRIQLERSQERYAKAREMADRVLETEQDAAELRAALDEANEAIELHDRLALPIRISALLATIVNRVPSGVTLDRIDLSTTVRSAGSRTKRRNQSDSASSPEVRKRRLLIGEIAGFAISDEAIARLIASLQETPLRDSVGLDFSRTRSVRSRPAREFRMSFRFDLDSVYEPAEAMLATVGGGDDGR